MRSAFLAAHEADLAQTPSLTFAGVAADFHVFEQSVGHSIA